MSSETITRNDLKNILDEILPLIEFTTDTKSGSVSIPASEVGTATIDMTKSGYSLIGVVGIKTSGSGSSLGYIYSFFINNSTDIVVYFRNSTSTARNYTVEVTGLYLKNAS